MPKLAKRSSDNPQHLSAKPLSGVAEQNPHDEALKHYTPQKQQQKNLRNRSKLHT